MFNSKSHLKIDDIPSGWIFNYYLNIPVRLTGQSMSIKSLFNPKDTNPSMVLYVHKTKKKYVFKCHSSGKYGDGINLVCTILNLDFIAACKRIINDYTRYVNDGEDSFMGGEELEFTNWKVTSHTVRSWMKKDADFWLKYNIGSSMLTKYNVKPLEHFTMTEINANTGEALRTVSSEEISYGYFTKDNVLYKIYKPYNRKRKFLKILDYVQGSEQLEKHTTLVITSSLKDIMAIKSLGLRVDCVAPDSESTKFTKDQLKQYAKQYKRIVVCLDSDEAGVKAMKFYKETYKLPFMYLPREKDISDIIKYHGKQIALEDFYPRLHACMDAYSPNFD